MWISGASFVVNVLEIIHLLFHGKLDFMVKLCTYIEVNIQKLRASGFYGI